MLMIARFAVPTLSISPSPGLAANLSTSAFQRMGEGSRQAAAQVEPQAKIKTLVSARDATRANVEAYLRELAKEAKPDDSLVLMMIGHGSFDEFDYKFNLPGPDIIGDGAGRICSTKFRPTSVGRQHDQRERRVDSACSKSRSAW